MSEELTEEQVVEQNDREDIFKEIFEGGPKVEDETPPEEEDIKPKEDDDPFAGLDPAVRKTIEDLTSRVSYIDTLENRLKQTESRLGALTNKQAAEKKALEEAEKNKPTKEELDAALEDETSWNEFEKEFPDIAKAINLKQKNQAKEIESMREKLSTFEKKTVVEDKPDVNIEVEIVSRLHPDWKETIKSDEYRKWLSDQEDTIKQKAAHGTKAEDAISVLSKFNEFKKETKSKTPQEIEAARKKRLSISENSTNKHKTNKPKSAEDMNEDEVRASIAEELWANKR